MIGDWFLISVTWNCILDVLYLISDTWYIILDIWYFTMVTWYLILNIQYLIYDWWYLILFLCFPILNIWYSIYNTQYIYDTWDLLIDIIYLMSDTWYCSVSVYNTNILTIPILIPIRFTELIPIQILRINRIGKCISILSTLLTHKIQHKKLVL